MNDHTEVKAFGVRLRTWRVRKGLTIREASTIIGVPTSTYYSWEVHAVFPSRRNALRLRQVVRGVDVRLVD